MYIKYTYMYLRIYSFPNPSHKSTFQGQTGTYMCVCYKNRFRVSLP